ncbi:MAG: hypothetical protein H7Y37_08890 [Anaerolineae bacterium]|nr:hypothetical protein [Gloeobacterales cyanobacterium ES-bin-313]
MKPKLSRVLATTCLLTALQIGIGSIVRSQESNPTTTSTAKKVNKIGIGLESETAQPGDIPGETLGIRSLMRLLKQEYRVGESIILEETMSNPTDYDLDIPTDCESEIPKLHIFVRDEAGNSVPLQDAIQAARTKVKVKVEVPADTETTLTINNGPFCPGGGFPPRDSARGNTNISSMYKITKPGVYHIIWSQRYTAYLGPELKTKWIHVTSSVTAVVVK